MEKIKKEKVQIAEKKQKLGFGGFILKYNAPIILVILLIVASLISPTFLTITNIFTVLRQQAVYLIIAMGMLMVIITAGIDLAAAATTALCSVILGCAVVKWTALGMTGSVGGTWLAILFTLVCAAAIGGLNGVLVSKLRMPAFIVTLAISYAAEGVAYMITKGNTVMLLSGMPAYDMLVYPGFAFMTTPLLKIPLTVVLAFVIVIIFHVVMKYTTFGRMVYAIGSNESAVQLAGINSKKYLFFVYFIEGILCGIGGIVLVCRSGNASALTCSGDYAMNTIAGVVIGGASLAGGEGTVIQTVIGVFVIAVIGNIMNLINLPQYPQYVIKAAVIILAVLLKSVNIKKKA